MAIGLLANSKSALIFAGGVIGFAVIAATSLGGQFTPGDQSGEPPRAAVPVPAAERVSNPAPSPDSDYADQDDQSVFGDFDGLNDETDLIDDTMGFDTNPGEITSTIIDDDAGPDFNAPPTNAGRAPPPRPAAQTQPRPQQRRALQRRPSSGRGKTSKLTPLDNVIE